MENPLSKEQIEELNELSRLPAEEQQIKLQSFLKTLTPEQINFLKSQQQPKGCLFCLMNEGKIPVHKVYEDEKVMAVLDINPANKGHTLVFPKKHYEGASKISEEDIGYLFNVANKVALNLVDVIKAEGFNILFAEGAVAGQITKHVMVHVIPRFKEDGVNLSWEAKQFSEEEMKGVVNAMRLKSITLKKDSAKIEEVEKLASGVYNADSRIP